MSPKWDVICVILYTLEKWARPKDISLIPENRGTSVRFGGIAVFKELNSISCAGIQSMLERVAGEKGLVWEEFFAKLKKNEQWHVEVY